MHRRARSTVSDGVCHGSAMHSASSSTHRASSRRPTSHNPEAAEGELANGRAAPMMEPTKTPRTPTVLPRSSSLSYSSSSKASIARPAVKVEETTDGFQPRTVDVRPGEEDLRNAIALRNSLPTYEIQRRYWMSLSPTNSSLNFSGTPDYIPASVYSLSPTSGGEAHRRERALLLSSSSSSIEGVRPSGGTRTIADKLNDLNFETDSTFTEYSRLSEVEGNRTNSFSSESTAHPVKKKLFQKGIGSKRQPMKVGSTERRSSRNHQTSSIRPTRNEHSAEVDQATVSADSKALVFGKVDHNEVFAIKFPISALRSLLLAGSFSRRIKLDLRISST